MQYGIAGMTASRHSRIAPGLPGRLTISVWPRHPVMQLQPKFPTAVGFAGATFPLLANQFVVESSSSIPEVTRPGDVILELRRVG